MRAALIDRFVPSMQWAMAPVTWTVGVMDNYQSYSRLLAQNQQLREELKQMRQWKEAALQLSQTNARLLDLNQVRLDPRLTHVTGVVLADSGSPFRQSVLLNVGARDGIVDRLQHRNDPRQEWPDCHLLVLDGNNNAELSPHA